MNSQRVSEMEKPKVSYQELIMLDHAELSKKDPEYYNKVNEIIERGTLKTKENMKGFFNKLKHGLHKALQLE